MACFVLLFALKLKLLPAQGNGWTKYFVLPVVAQSLGGISGMVRTARAAMLEVVRADYVTTARSKGLSERKVIYEHALPNAMLPIISVLSGQLCESAWRCSCYRAGILDSRNRLIPDQRGKYP